MASEVLIMAQWPGVCWKCHQAFEKSAFVMMNKLSKAKRHKKCPEKKESKKE